MEADINLGTIDEGRADGSQGIDGEPMEQSDITGTEDIGDDTALSV